MPNNQPLIVFAEISLWLFALFLLIPVVVLFVECSAAWLPARSSKSQSPQSRPSVAVLIPAHNEASGIQQTLLAVLQDLASADRLIVVADNCEDDTAIVARTTGAIVVERQDSQLRGKGYALDFGLRYLAADPPEVVVMMDADCTLQPGTINQIVDLAASSHRPVQAIYLLNPPAQVTAKSAVSSLAFLVKNQVRPLGLKRLGLPCLLTGTGMAFPWELLKQVSLASSNIVEDMQLGLDLAVASHAPILCPTARVMGTLPQQQQAAVSQRTRWEHGHLQTLLHQVPRLLMAAIQQRRLELLALAADLCVPPLSLLVMLWVVSAVSAGTAVAAGISWGPGLLLALEGFLIFSAIVGAWLKFGRAELPLHTLLTIPLYVLWKVPIYLAFLIRPQNKWVRTERDPVSSVTRTGN